MLFILLLIVMSMAGLWFFQGWKMTKNQKTRRTLHNIYITKVEKTALQGIDGGKKTWMLASHVKNEVKPGVADLVLEENRVLRIIQKPDYLQGKILKIKENSIQVEEYGEVELDDNFRLFHIDSSGEVSSGKREDLTIGYTDIRYVVAGTKICAAVLGDKRPANIRVLLSRSADSQYAMQEVTVSGTSDYEVIRDGKTASYAAGHRLNYGVKDVSDRIVIRTKKTGKIRLENLKRQYGVPEYYGTIEINRDGKNLYVINEVNLEEYLYSVVPSEMPTEYPKEALKAQAICARTYALLQMKGRRLADYGAHVDDSTSFQVYNNIKEDDASVQAVKETAHLAASRKGKLITTYFYSVSSGCSEGVKDVWFAKKDLDYLPIQWQGEIKRPVNLSEEKNFTNFLSGNEETYDSDSPWYRWQTSLTAGLLEKQITKRAEERFAVNPTQIQTKQADGSYRSSGETDIGTLKDMRIVQRGKGGVACMMELVGSKHTLRVYTEYNIRYLLGVPTAVYKRKDKKEVTGLSMLPSGFFTFEKKHNGFLFLGGGYGHGVGMSQFGAKTLAEKGKSFQDILNFYFSGTTVIQQEFLAENR